MTKRLLLWVSLSLVFSLPAQANSYVEMITTPPAAYEIAEVEENQMPVSFEAPAQALTG